MSYCFQPVPFDPGDSVLTGMSTPALQALLTSAQKAYSDYLLGQKTVTVSYTQGDGSKTVTYDRTNLAQLTSLIRLVQAMLGINTMGRRPVRFDF